MNKKEYVSIWVKIFGEKPKIDLALMTDRNRAIYKWRKCVRLITTWIYALIWNTILIIGWYTQFKTHSNLTLEQIGTQINTVVLGVGHISCGLIHTLLVKLTGTKVNKKETFNGTHVFKTSKLGILFTILIIIPILIYLIGYIFIICKYDKYINSFELKANELKEFKDTKKIKILKNEPLKDNIDSIIDDTIDKGINSIKDIIKDK